jgi:hypothetical protein
VQDSSGETPLHKVGRKYYFSSYRMLVAKGAKEDVQNILRETPRALLYDDVRI